MKIEGIKGALFEMCVLKLTLMSGYELIKVSPNDKKYKKSGNKIICKGRGENHQIDIPVDLKYKPSFIYPIRLLGEAKYHNKPITKKVVREEIGKMNDIQENYFVNGVVTEEMMRNRRTELFALFSANGFDLGAENLAYAHDIKTVSFYGNKCFDGVVAAIDKEAERIFALSIEQQSEELDDIYKRMILEEENPNKDDIHLLSQLSRIKVSLLGKTQSGLIISFLSYDEFPDYLFETSDIAYYTLHFENHRWWLQMNGSTSKLYFSMPNLLYDNSSAFSGKDATKYFEDITFEYTINNINRKLTLKFDGESFIE